MREAWNGPLCTAELLDTGMHPNNCRGPCVSHCELDLAVGKKATHLWTQMSSGQGKLQATEPELVQEQLMAARPVSAQAQAQLPAAVLGSAQAQGLQLLGKSRA